MVGSPVWVWVILEHQQYTLVFAPRQLGIQEK